MSMTMISQSDLGQDVADMLKAADNGPVLITYHGVPRHMLLSVPTCLRTIPSERSLADVLAMDDADEFELEIPERVGRPELTNLD